MDGVLAIIAGGLLVSATWLVLLVVVSLSGLAICSLFSRSTVGLLGSLSIRRSMWWGLAFFTILVLAASLVTPLGGPTAALFVVIVLIISSVMGEPNNPPHLSDWVCTRVIGYKIGVR